MYHCDFSLISGIELSSNIINVDYDPDINIYSCRFSSLPDAFKFFYDLKPGLNYFYIWDDSRSVSVFRYDLNKSFQNFMKWS